MSFALWQKNIECPNCKYTGRAKLVGPGCGAWFAFLIILIISFYFWPLFLVAGLMLLWLIFQPAKQICPKCKFQNPIPK